MSSKFRSRLDLLSVPSTVLIFWVFLCLQDLPYIVCRTHYTIFDPSRNVTINNYSEVVTPNLRTKATFSQFDPWFAFEELYEEQPNKVSLNYSKFNFGHRIMHPDLHIPRVLLEMFANAEIGDSVLQNVDIVRHFPVIYSKNLSPSTFRSKPTKNTFDEEKIRVEVPSVSDTKRVLFAFNATFFHTDDVHSVIFRVFTRSKRKKYELVGVHRRIMLYPMGNGRLDPSFVDHDVYLYNNSWTSIDVTHIISNWFHSSSNSQMFCMEILPPFPTVGGPGELEFIVDASSQLRPHLILYANEKFHRRHRRSVVPFELEEEESNSIWEGTLRQYNNIPQQANVAKKLSRKARLRRTEKSCKKKPLNINFKTIGWDSWVFAPPSYEAFQCNGKCFYPLPSHLTPTMHAIIQNLAHSEKPEEASRACCVPTRLGAISLLYLQNGVLTFNKKYRGMVVEDCGCR